MTSNTSFSQNWLLLFLFFLATTLSACHSNDSSDMGLEPNQAMTLQGLVEGVEETALVSFKGIPYAAAPVNERRFASPAPAADWSDTLVADEFASACPQTGGSFGTASTDENCLFLNVYTPDTAGQYPVMVWIHGGALVSGSGGASYQPERLVDKGLVVVTVNYRLGALGFLAHTAISDEMGEGSGNFGLMDQQLALQWVQNNIENFGGDAQNVTLFGESAGGHSVLSQLVSPQAAGLFHKAIVQSGSYNPDQLSLGIASALGGGFASALACNDVGSELSCLRALSVEDILANSQGSYVPNTGTSLLPTSIRDAVASGVFNQVPVMEGTNLNEGSLFVALQELAAGAITSELVYRGSVSGVLSEDPRPLDVNAIATRYLDLQESTDEDRYSVAFSAIQTDWRFACEGLNQVLDLSQYVSTYVYHFTDQHAPSLFPPVLSFPLGATHAAEIQYVLSSEQTMLDRGADVEQLALSDSMLAYWSEFAKKGDPNSDSGATSVWPELGASGMILELNAPTIVAKSTADFDSVHSCSSFWANPPQQIPAT
ncbi:MAG: carboxylesterase family protein [Spongiibacteraceae bacterium]|nr:carboxylesterase family protein [Spongiibacteraceae bacterium]